MRTRTRRSASTVGPGECAESVGVQQVRYPYHQWAFPWATYSTAQNLDYALAVRRACFEGYETWFNQVERGRDYVAGDLWGCVGPGSPAAGTRRRR